MDVSSQSSSSVGRKMDGVKASKETYRQPSTRHRRLLGRHPERGVIRGHGEGVG